MELKKISRTIVATIIAMILLMFLLYDFEMSLLNLSNVIFYVGIFLCLPGVVIVTGAGQVFESSGYLTRKIFGRNRDNDFKSFGEYKEYKNLKRLQTNKKGRGMTSLVLGGIYIVVSLVISFIA